MSVVNYCSATLTNPTLMHEPIYYSILWTFIGILFLGIIFLVVFFILYSTRKKPIKSIANLALAKPQPKDIESIRKKYLQMVDEVEQFFGMHKIRASVAHQKLSLILRLYYAEVSGFHAEVLTLRDLNNSKNQKLANLIGNYYPDEFNCLEHGSVLESSRRARELIMDNEAISRIQLGDTSTIILPNKRRGQ